MIEIRISKHNYYTVSNVLWLGAHLQLFKWEAKIIRGLFTKGSDGLNELQYSVVS